MNELFSERIKTVPRSFIREILKVAVDPEIISFAGGLPNKELFPVAALKEAADLQFDESGQDILQYSSTEGYPPLREYIANRYQQKGLDISAENILISSGSQQALDLLAKIFINPGDQIIIEEPGYLGAIQSFAIYQPDFQAVQLAEDGLNLEMLTETLNCSKAKLIYLVPNFQNPTGVSYSAVKRQQMAELLKNQAIYLVEDDPYGELRYVGQEIESFKQLLPEQTILLGSFSKVVAPGFRIGWIVAPDQVLEKLITAKQASDLHTSYIGQRILYQYLIDNELDQHLVKLKTCYNRQREAMLTALKKYLPAAVSTTEPAGGMFLWLTLPEGLKALDLFELALKKKVAFVPGDPFYVGKKGLNTLRLNFSCSTVEIIEEGVRRLAESIAELMASS